MSAPTAATRAVALLATTAAGLTGLVAAGAAPAQAAPSSPYLFGSFSYGTSISGGSLPGSSGKSAYAVVGCTNLAGAADDNQISGLNLDGLKVGAVSSHSRTYRSHGAYVSSGVSRIASLVAGQSTGPQLSMKRLRAVSLSWHDAKGYHSSLRYSGLLAYTPLPGLPAQPVAFPRDGQTVQLPGVGTLTGGTKNLRHGSTYAGAAGYSLRLHLDASNSTVRIGHTSTLIQRAIAAGVLGGRAFGSQGTAAGGDALSGATAVKVLPCQGTGGKLRSNTTATSTIPGALSTGATVSTVRGSSNRYGGGDAWTRSTVNRVSIGGGQAVIRGIRANAHVHRTAHGTLVKDAHRTSPGTITVDGRTTRLPARGRYVVPGVARIATTLVTETTTGIEVVAVRVTLLSGPANHSVIDLGNARARITRH
jgi:hypothetical protein